MKYILLALILIAGSSGALAQAPQAQNALITQANAALAAHDWADAERLLKQLIALAPYQWDYKKGLGDAQANQGHYQEAMSTYEQALVLAARNASAAGADGANAKAALPTIVTAKGNMLLKLNRNAEALAEYSRAAPLSATPAVAYFNICAVAYNMGKPKDALPACNKAISADPTKADAYFIKGSVLFADATIDAKGKMVFPPAAIQALQKYLEVAPNGGHAADVKEMLKAAGETGAPHK